MYAQEYNQTSHPDSTHQSLNQHLLNQDIGIEIRGQRIDEDESEERDFMPSDVESTQKMTAKDKMQELAK